jgi:hypothetical protein
MIHSSFKTCNFADCSKIPIYGYSGEKPIFCELHKEEDMVNIEIEEKCSHPECKFNFDIIINSVKYCIHHCPNEDAEIATKRKCMYCDIKGNSTFICNDCKMISNKKEWGIVRYLKKIIKTPFIHNSSIMLGGCSKKRPDIFFELPTHCVIGEIDEHQHKNYDDKCECSRISEIVGSIGGKSVIFVRFNPDKTMNQGKDLKISLSDKIDLFVEKIEEEISKQYLEFQVKIYQLYYDDNYQKYQRIKEEDITKFVCV